MAAKKGPKVFGTNIPAKTKRVAIGIDQSYSGFGVTFMDLDSSAFRTVVFKGEGIGVDRLIDISLKLSELVEENVPYEATEVVVAMEGYAFGSQMANMAGELGATVKLLLRDYLHKYSGAYPYIIPPTVLKKYVTGKGTGVQKNQILLHVFKKWNVEFNDDNAADSYALAHMVAGKCDLAYEREIYHNIQDPKYREK
jgi:hypothetical protein